jgi:ketosteroid isomerase-like protein
MTDGDTRTVVEHHLEALQAGDVDAIMSDYAEDAILMLPGSVVRGSDAVRGLMEQACATLFKPGASEFTLQSFEAEGPYAMITWSLRSDVATIPFGTDTFLVEAGAIRMQTGCTRET